MEDDLDPNPPLHTIQDIVTPGPMNAASRMRVDGGWIYWITTGVGPVSSFVPDAPPAPSATVRVRG